MITEKACLTCGLPFTPTLYGQRRCLKHEARGRESRSPTTRAQDAEYARNRKVVLAGDPPCHWCGAPATTADHLLAVARGGTNALANLAPACSSCNSSRQANPDWTAPRHKIAVERGVRRRTTPHLAATRLT